MDITSLNSIMMPGTQIAPKIWQTGFLKINTIIGMIHNKSKH